MTDPADGRTTTVIEIDPKVTDAVREALTRSPQPSPVELYELAKTVNPDIAKLDRRQFHARYPLQIKREQAKPRPRKARVKRTRREAVRAVFLEFANELAEAEERKDIVRVLSQVDKFVDKALEASKR